MSRKSRGLKRQILLYLILSTLLVFLITEALIIEKNRRNLMKGQDQTALTYARGLASLTEVEPGGRIEFEFSAEIMPDFGGHKPRAYFLILKAADGSEVYRSPSLQHVDFSPPEFLHETGERIVYWNSSINDRTVRFVALREFVRVDDDDEDDTDDEDARHVPNGANASLRSPDNEFLFIVGLDQKIVYDRLINTVEVITPTLAVGLGLMLVFVWFAIDRNLKPLYRFQQEVQSISPANISPVTVPPVEEIAGMARTFNQMIADIREAFERERRFTANVAHELRTPVSEMRSLAEVALRYQTDLDAQNRKNYEDILASAKEMQATVLNLLTLARCDSGKLQPEKERIPLEPLVSSTWREFADAAASKAIRVHHEVSADTSITTDEALFRLILKNLFSNAVRYTNEGGEIEWKTVVDEDNFSFSLSNSTENLSGHDISCIFEPFWQKDKARTSGDAHSGLGLSLVQSLAALLGLQVSARLTTPTHLTVTLSGKITPTA